MNARTQWSRQETGTAMVEMALVLPLLLLLVLGMVDIARALNYWNDTNQLAGEAARHAAVNRNPGQDAGQTLEQYVRCRAETREVRGPGVVCPGDPADPRYDSDSVQTALVVCRMPGPTDVGDPITIRVQTRYYVLPIVREAPVDSESFASIGLTGEATMRLEQKFTQTITECAPSA